MMQKSGGCEVFLLCAVMGAQCMRYCLGLVWGCVPVVAMNNHSAGVCI